MQRALVFLLILTLFSSQAEKSANAADRMRGPFKSGEVKPQPYYQTSTSKVVLNGLIKIYSHYISPADGPRSPSFPTGSAYGRQAISTYGFIPGVFLIADRLFHESDQHLGYPIVVFGRTRYNDPLEHNTFWWDSELKAEISPSSE